MAHRSKSKRNNRPALALQYEPDNAATTSFRHGKEPTGVITLSGPFCQWARTNLDGTQGLRIGILTETHIVLSLSKKSFLIWGSATNVERANALLTAWISDVSGSVDRRFGRITAYRWLDTIRSLQRNELEEHLQNFRKTPDRGSLYAPIIYGVRWQFSQPPQLSLGSNLEALDDIRMELQCWVDCQQEAPNKWIFGVLSQSKTNAFTAARRLSRNVHWNAAAVDSSTSGRFYLVKPTLTTTLNSAVEWIPYTELNYDRSEFSKGKGTQSPPLKYVKLHKTRTNTEFGKNPFRKPKFITGINEFQSDDNNKSSASGSIVISNTLSTSINPLYIEFWLSEMLKPMRYFIGTVKMRATIGVASWVKYPVKPSMDLESFQKLLRETNRQENPAFSKMMPLPANLGENILRRFLESSDFSPAHPWRRTKSDNLDQGIFEIAGPSQINAIFELCESNEAGKTMPPNRRLTRSFNHATEPGDTAWEVLPSPGPALDITILDLTSPGTSQNLSVSRGFALPRRALVGMAEYLCSFSEGIKLLPSAFDGHSAQTGGQAFVMPGSSTLDSSSSLQFPDMQAVKQETIWKFTSKSNPGYKIDLVLVQEFEIEKMYRKGLNTELCFGAKLHPLESGWTVRVWHEAWDEKLDQNVTMKAGERADWVAEEWDLFPVLDPTSDSMQVGGESWRGRAYERGSGVKEWLRVMKEVESVIKQVEQVVDLLA